MRKQLKNPIAVTLLILHIGVAAQNFDPDAQQKGFTQLEQTGKLVRIVVTPVKKDLQLEVFGLETAGVTVKNQEIEARYILNGEEKKLSLKPEKKPDGKGHLYRLSQLPTPVEKLKIDVNTSKGKDTVEISPPK